MYHDLLQGMGPTHALNALATGWIHPKLDQLYIQSGQHVHIPTLDGRWLRLTPSHPDYALELRWAITPPSVVKKRFLHQISIVNGDVFLTMNKLCHAKVYQAGTETTVEDDITWSVSGTSDEYVTTWANRLLINGKPYRLPMVNE